VLCKRGHHQQQQQQQQQVKGHDMQLTHIGLQLLFEGKHALQRRYFLTARAWLSYYLQSSKTDSTTSY
jgi:extradiol dioxygenase family protein